MVGNVQPVMAEGSLMGNRKDTMRTVFAAAAMTALVVAGFGLPAVAAGDRPSYNRGAMTAFVMRKEPVALPDIAFKDGQGNPVTLADWRGRVVLINLWATWCAPCRREMPSLSRLQVKLGGDDFEVLAISVDRKGAEASAKFLSETGAENLALYVDETFKVARDLKAPGLPVTILVDRQGREIGRVTGPAEWDSEDALALIGAVIEDRAAAQ
jgi:thiol-disulfide isomerase/thioredoxin